MISCSCRPAIARSKGRHDLFGTGKRPGHGVGARRARICSTAIAGPGPAQLSATWGQRAQVGKVSTRAAIGVRALRRTGTVGPGRRPRAARTDPPRARWATRPRPGRVPGARSGPSAYSPPAAEVPGQAAADEGPRCLAAGACWASVTNRVVNSLTPMQKLSGAQKPACLASAGTLCIQPE